MHSSRMCTAHLLTISRSIPCILGGLPNPPWMQTSLEADPPGGRPTEADPPGCRLAGHVNCDACSEANLPHPHGQKE